MRNYALKNKAFIAVASTLLLMLLLLSGLFPNMAGSSLTSRFTVLGHFECAADFPSFIKDFSCPSVGGSTGEVVVIESPIVIIGWIFMKLFFLNAEWAFFITASLIMLASLIGAYKLIRVFDVQKYIALAFASLYLIMPITMSMQDFGGTYWGALLLPFYTYCTYYFLNRIKESKNWRSKIGIAVSWVLLSTFQLFMDGYTFVMASAVSACLIFFWSWRKWEKKETWLGYFIFVLAISTAYLLFTLLVAGSGDWKSPVALFRSMSLDLSTVFTPSKSLWWVQEFNIKTSTGQLWGDGTNSKFNYVGYSLILLVLVGFYGLLKKLNFRKFRYFFVGRKRIDNKTILFLALLCAMLIAFVLSLGPSLKWQSVRPPVVGKITYDDYLMPKEAALIDLPTDFIYAKAPGISSMRATYRWHLLTVMVFTVFAAIGVQYIIKKKRYKIAALSTLIVFLELSPNIVSAVEKNISNGAKIDDFNMRVIKPLDLAFPENTNVIFYPNAIDGNDYLVNYIVPMANLKTYNVGGDKAVKEASLERPEEIKTLLSFNDNNRAEHDEKILMDILQKKYVDYIVVPYFDLRWDSYNWNTKSLSGKERAIDLLSRIEDDKKFQINKYEYFAIVSLNKPDSGQ